MGLAVFGACYLAALIVYVAVMRLARPDGRAFSALKEGLLTPLGVIFGLSLAFMGAEVREDFERAKQVVVTEANALDTALRLAQNFPAEDAAKIRAFVNEHVETAVRDEWPNMADRSETLPASSEALTKALQQAVSSQASTDSEKAAQGQIMAALQAALDARRARIVISQTTLNAVTWLGLLLQGLCLMVAIAMIQVERPKTCAIALVLFATGVAGSIMLIAAHDHPFNGDIAIKPDLLLKIGQLAKSGG
jgi:hypothetical protein